jgi:hypothetical protein
MAQWASLSGGKAMDQAVDLCRRQVSHGLPGVKSRVRWGDDITYAEMWPKYITSLSGDVSALHLLSEILSFIAVELYLKLVPEMHHFSHYEIRVIS